MNAFSDLIHLGRRMLSPALLLGFVLSAAAAVPTGALGKFKIVDGAKATAQWDDQTVVLEKGKTYAAASSIVIESPKSGNRNTLLFSNGITVFLEPGSLLQIDEFRQVNGARGGPVSPEKTASLTRFTLLEGAAFFVPGRLHQDSSFSVQTPGGTIKSRGNFYVRQSISAAQVTMQSGTAEVWRDGTSLEGAPSQRLGSGQQMALPHSAATTATVDVQVRGPGASDRQAPVSGQEIDSGSLSPLAEAAARGQNSNFSADDQVVVLGAAAAGNGQGVPVSSPAQGGAGDAAKPVDGDLMVYLSRLAEGAQYLESFDEAATTVVLGHIENDASISATNSGAEDNRSSAADAAGDTRNTRDTNAAGGTDGTGDASAAGDSDGTAGISQATRDYLESLLNGSGEDAASNAAGDPAIVLGDNGSAGAPAAGDTESAANSAPVGDPRATGSDISSDTDNGTSGIPPDTGDYLDSLVDGADGTGDVGGDTGDPIVIGGNTDSGTGGAGTDDNSAVTGNGGTGGDTGTGTGGTGDTSGTDDGTSGIPADTSEHLDDLVNGSGADGAGDGSGDTGDPIVIGGNTDSGTGGAGADGNPVDTGNGGGTGGTGNSSDTDDGTSGIPPGTDEHLDDLVNDSDTDGGPDGADGGDENPVVIGDDTNPGTGGAGNEDNPVDDGTSEIPPGTNDHLDGIIEDSENGGSGGDAGGDDENPVVIGDNTNPGTGGAGEGEKTPGDGKPTEPTPVDFGPPTDPDGTNPIDDPSDKTPVNPIIITPPETIDPGKIVSPATLPPGS